MDRLTIYRVPEGAEVPCSYGTLPPGDYILPPLLNGCDPTVIVALSNSRCYWVEAADIAPYAVVFVPEKKEEEVRCP